MAFLPDKPTPRPFGNRVSYALATCVVLSLGGLTSCGEPRLLEPDPPEQDIVADEPQAEEFGTDHLHEDGNWYAGWAVTASAEMTDAAVVEDDRIIIPRNEVFDAELSTLSLMDILVGASPSTGFIKRVVHVDKGDEYWELHVIKADLGEVFLEGDFEFSLSSPPPVDKFDEEPEVEPNPSGLTTYRQELRYDTVKVPFDYSCNEAGNGCLTAETGFTLDFKPNFDLVKDSTGEPEFEARTVFQGSSEFVIEDEVQDQNTRGQIRTMCASLSTYNDRLNQGTSEYSRGVKLKNEYLKQQGRMRQARAYKDLMKWSLVYGGHSLFPPYVPQRDKERILIQSKTGGEWCQQSNLHFFRGYVHQGDHQDACRGANALNQGHIYYVSESQYNSYPGYAVYNGNPFGSSLNPFTSNFWTATNLTTLQNRLRDFDFHLEGDDRDRSKVFYAMSPAFRRATFWTHEQVLSGRDNLDVYFESQWPRHFDRWDRDPERNGVDHRWSQYVQSNIKTNPAISAPSLEEVLAPFKQASESPYVRDDDFQDMVSTLEDQPLIRDANWLHTAMAVGKFYCSNIPSQNMTAGVGAKMQFDWEPEITLSFSGERSEEENRRLKSKRWLKRLSLGEVSSWFSVGPIPVYMTLDIGIKTESKFTATANVNFKFRKHRADLDFFWGLTKNENGWRQTTPQDYREITGQPIPEGAESSAEAQKLEFFGSPNSLSDEEYRANTPMITAVSGNLNAKYEFKSGLNAQLILYRTAGVGVTFGVDVNAELEAGYDNAKFKAEAGPSVTLEGILDIPFCGEGCAQTIKDHLCRYPPLNGTVCNQEWCALNPSLCPKLDTDRGQIQLVMPLFKSCAWITEELKPTCTAADPFDIIFKPWPLCVAMCYDPGAPTGNDWVAVKTRDLTLRPDHPAGMTGLPIDSIYIKRGDQIIQPVQSEVDGESFGPEATRRLAWLDSQNFNECNYEAWPNRAMNVTDYMFVEFEDMQPGDEIVIVRQNFPPGAEKDPPFRPCTVSNGALDVFIGTAAGGTNNRGFWNTVAENEVNSVREGIILRASHFASDTNKDHTSAFFR